MAALFLALAALSPTAWAQTAFNGFIKFRDSDGNIHTQTFNNIVFPGSGGGGGSQWNRALPGYYALDGHASNGLWHLSCSDDLSDNTARVDLDWYDEYFGSYDLTSPTTALPAGFTDGETVEVIDWYLDRVGTNGGTCGTPVIRPDPRFGAGKTAVGNYDRQYKWTIEKSVTPAAASIFFGDSQAYDYTVDVEPNGYEDINHTVTGLIVGTNTGDVNVTVTQVADSFPGSSNVMIDCGGGPMPSPVALNIVVIPGADLACAYTADSDGTPGINTATINYMFEGGETGSVQFGNDFTFGSPPVNEYDTTVSVQDQFDGGAVEPLGTCTTTDGATSSGDGCSSSYTRTLDCSDIGVTVSGNSGSKSNTATIVETGQTSMESVMLTCYALDVSKTADPAFTREYHWTVDKLLNDDEPIRVMEGQSYELDYSVFVDLDEPPYTDSDWSLSGDITVSNPATIPATINGLSDVFTGGTGDVDCGSDAPWVIAAGGTLDCTYSGDSNGSTPGTNTATATQQNYAYDATGVGSPTGTTNYQGTADFNMANPTMKVNACVDVWDVLSVEGVFEDDELLMLEGALVGDPSLCYYDAPAEFGYTYETIWFPVGSKDLEEPVCELLVDNEAFVFPFVEPNVILPANAPEGEPLAYDIVSTLVQNSECVFGCTLTQGYWKTHSAYGPAPYDETWALVGEDTPFFLSGLSWHDIMWTPPRGGNAYIQLAHQWIAAYMNHLNEASSTPEVDDALANGLLVFEACEPWGQETTQGKGGKSKKPAPGASCAVASDWQMRQWANTLDRYNNGEIGPGHCSENEEDDD
ncbi:hypothetical protein F3N42_01075 [Marinihelvus fidelis]|uniref:Uncharacterized protein n=1 Tax=Marinihelvus fidelis TaxID=2613842 RepID=A0A5N0TGF0_9GAMM|nr:hypothetical protein [Marinihelvus fidelis]KAA9134165.1 hypothetical protein F3N42_01075 [Marinihelvus fidelis]